MVYIDNIQNLVDFDDLFIINPITREIITETKKLYLMQHDHNSEIIRFQVPRVIEGYDIAQCNRVEIHYTNINSRTEAIDIEHAPYDYIETTQKIETEEDLNNENH